MKNSDLMLDTNILIYWFRGNEKILEFLSQYEESYFYVSVITYIEVLVGCASDEERQIALKMLKKFRILPQDLEISKMVVDSFEMMNKRSLRDINTADIIIANTALYHNLPLASNNPRNFKKFKGLEIIVP